MAGRMFKMRLRFANSTSLGACRL